MENGSAIISHKEFYLNGFTNLKRFRPPLFIPFFIIFVFCETANASLVAVILKQPKLHAPMYILIGAIACLGVAIPITFAPRMLINLLTGRNEISRIECLIQMFTLHYCACYQSTILLGMAIDRYVAIRIPLRYNNIISYRNSLIFIIIFVLRNTVIMLVVVGFMGTLSFCKSNIIYHCFCEQTSVVKAACGDVSRNYVAGVVSFCIPTTDCVFIVSSYLAIFWSIIRSPSGESRQKAFHTCTTHIIGFSVAYFSAMVAFLGYRVSTIPQDVRVLVSLMYLLFPSVMNPIIYGYRTKEIRIHLLRLFRCDKS